MLKFTDWNLLDSCGRSVQFEKKKASETKMPQVLLSPENLRTKAHVTQKLTNKSLRINVSSENRRESRNCKSKDSAAKRSNLVLYTWFTSDVKLKTINWNLQSKFLRGSTQRSLQMRLTTLSATPKTYLLALETEKTCTQAVTHTYTHTHTHTHHHHHHQRVHLLAAPAPQIHRIELRKRLEIRHEERKRLGARLVARQPRAVLLVDRLVPLYDVILVAIVHRAADELVAPLVHLLLGPELEQSLHDLVDQSLGGLERVQNVSVVYGCRFSNKIQTARIRARTARPLMLQ